MDCIIENTPDRIGPKIAVLGVGGAGSNAIDNMIRMGLNGVTFLVCNTDEQALSQSLCPASHRICLGYNVTKGLGAGSSPDVGRAAAEESLEDIMRQLNNIHMLFITAGMGGGTGTGGSPVIAQAARDKGILTVGVVTKPFHFEGTRRMRSADKGIENIKECVDTLLVIPNQNLFRLATDTTTFSQAFAMADDVLYSGVRTFTDLMLKPGLINLDFADICTAMRNTMGKAMMGTGESSSDNRAIEAAEKAIACLLLDDVAIRGARSVLINITGGPDLTLYDVNEAIGRVKQEVDHETPGGDLAHIIFGATFDNDLKGTLRVSVVATGIDAVEEKVETIQSSVPIETPEAASNYESLGSRHGDYAFDERHFSSFSLQEEREKFEYSEPHLFAKPKKKSFFERLTKLRKNKIDRPESRSPTLRPLEYEKSDKFYEKDPIALENSEDLEIPAFLRNRKIKK
jgi:cell division protein FtsZ